MTGNIRKFLFKTAIQNLKTNTSLPGFQLYSEIFWFVGKILQNIGSITLMLKIPEEVVYKVVRG
jgi:hypothetical protein